MKKYWSLLITLALITGSVFAAQNFLQDSGRVTYENTSAALSSGDLVDLGDRYGVCLVDIASNASGAVAIKGIWSLQRYDTNAIVNGAAIYYSTASNVTGTAAADKYIGQCVAAEAACTALTNSLGQFVKFVEVDLNVPQRQCIVGTDVQAYAAGLTAWAALVPSANGSALVVTNYATMKELLNLEIGTDVQAWDTDLDTYAAIPPTATAQLALQYGNNSVVLCKRQRIPVADINAGVSVLPAITGKSYRIINVTAIAYGGAVGTVTTVDVLGTQSAGGVKLVAFGQVSLTQSTVLQMGESGAAVTADGASYAACDAATAITVGKTGGDADTATGVDFVITYVIE